MKKFFLSPHFFLVALVSIAVLFMAAVSATGTKYNTSTNKAYTYEWTADTITDAGNDTLTIGDVQTSMWTGTFFCRSVQLSGTAGIAVIVQGCGFESPAAAEWAEVTRDTLNGTSENLILSVGTMGLLKYRIILDGYGTQSTTYDPILVLKKD